MTTIVNADVSIGDVEATIFGRLTLNVRKVRKAYNKLMELGRANNLSIAVTVTEGYEIPDGMSFPLAVVLASSQFHEDLDDIFTKRNGGHSNYCDIQHSIAAAHNRLTHRRGDGDGISVMVVVADMNTKSLEVKG